MPLQILKLPAVARRTGMSTDQIYRGERDGWFPRRVKLGSHDNVRASGWLEHEIDAWIEALAKARDAQPALASASHTPPVSNTPPKPPARKRGRPRKVRP
jgi:prophage regulatory protein